MLRWLILNLRVPKIAFSLLFIPLIICALPAQAQLQVRPLTHNGYSRPYLIYRPAHLLPHPALVIMLGGIRSTVESEAKNFGWMDEANRNGFLVAFPAPVRTDLEQPVNRKKNITFWQMMGSRTHHLAPGGMPVDDDGYLLAALQDILHRDHPNRRRVFLAGFSSGSGMVQLFAARHSKLVTAIVAVATPLMDPPTKLPHPVAVLYIHGDKDEQFSGFETHSPHFATTPHGNWVTWGYLNGCQKQVARTTDWGVQFSWQGCKRQVPVVADFVANLGHEWPGSLDSQWNQKHRPAKPLNFTDMAWRFFSQVRSR